MKRRTIIHKSQKYNFVLAHISECREVFCGDRFYNNPAEISLVCEATRELGYSEKTSGLDIIRSLRPIYFRVANVMRGVQGGLCHEK
jgi:hypothetical protein